MNTLSGFILTLWMFAECTDGKKYCWYFEEGYPIYFICRSYEDCCGTRCCVRALSIQQLWYFWLLLMMGILLCCGVGFFLRRRTYPSPLSEEPAFNVFFTRQPAGTSGAQQPGDDRGGHQGGGVTDLQGPPYPTHMMAAYPPPPSYCNHSPPPPYDQIFQTSDKK